jgi:hypothetical protein
MSKLFRKRPVAVEAGRWFQHGDLGAVERYCMPVASRPDDCAHCGREMAAHGWLDTLEGGHIVCPGDWVITGVAGERYPCKDDIFRRTYEPANEVGEEEWSR